MLHNGYCQKYHNHFRIKATKYHDDKIENSFYNVVCCHPVVILLSVAFFWHAKKGIKKAQKKASKKLKVK